MTNQSVGSSNMVSRSYKVAKLVAALSKAQGEIGEIHKNKTVTVAPRSGGQPYDFRYATLSSIIEAIRVPLSKNGILYTQTLEFDFKNNIHYLTTTLFHDEEYISSTTPLLVKDMGNQQFGSALTYMKRYALAAILGIAPDDDDDGNAADGNEVRAMAEAVAKSEPPKVVRVPAPDPIKPLVGETVEIAPMPSKIDVPLLPDDSGSDWMKWGKKMMALANALGNKDAIDKLKQLNEVPLKNMEISAPKMYSNLSLAIVRLEKSLEKPSAAQAKS